MNDAYSLTSDVEKRAMEILLPYAVANGAVITLVTGQPILQKHIGDMLYKYRNEGTETVELKAEESNRHGRLFLEYWSNLSRYTHGWLHTSEAEKLWYFFIEQGELYTLSMSELKKWAFADGHIYEHPLLKQKKYNQPNDTWGRCVPIRVLQADIPSFRTDKVTSVAEVANDIPW